MKSPWDGQAAASDLQAGLRELGVTRNVVLVGHSQAGEVAHYFVLANPGVVSAAVLIDANLPQFFTEAENRRLVALNAPQIEQLQKAPSTKANRQLIATADNFGPTHDAFPKVFWPDSVPVLYLVSEKTPFDGSPQDVQRWRDAAATFVKGRPRPHTRHRRGKFARDPDGQACPGTQGNRADGCHGRVMAIGPTRSICRGPSPQRRRRCSGQPHQHRQGTAIKSSCTCATVGSATPPRQGRRVAPRRLGQVPSGSADVVGVGAQD